MRRDHIALVANHTQDFTDMSITDDLEGHLPKGFAKQPQQPQGFLLICRVIAILGGAVPLRSHRFKSHDFQLVLLHLLPLLRHEVNSVGNKAA